MALRRFNAVNIALVVALVLLAGGCGSGNGGDYGGGRPDYAGKLDGRATEAGGAAEAGSST